MAQPDVVCNGHGSALPNVVIISACRTPIGKLNGALSSLPGHKLGSLVITESLKRASIRPEEVSEVILGQVLTGGQGQNPARQAAVAAGIPISVPAWSVQMVCGSGMKALVSAYQSIRNGDAKIVVAGGQESMSQAPHVISLRKAVVMGDTVMRDTCTTDGLTDAFNRLPDGHPFLMGNTAEKVAERWKVTRQEQDEYAAQSQQRAGAAQKAGYFRKEIIPVCVQSGKETVEVSADEFVKPDTTVEALARLRTVFQANGTVTPGNSSGVNDGAAAVVMMSEAEAVSRKLTPMARIVSWAQAGIDPIIMGVGPVEAVKKALSKASWNISDVDVFELNEAFAVSSIVCARELGVDAAKVNISGGSIALGHPIGASGARVVVSLLHGLERTGGHKGVAALCIGGGMGIALCVERT
ncbi:acetyl-CoA acetyltransferase, cytosolic-like isoform X2 [Paramacrobiotus metropolitanus]|uniref:acetyl-CoA acetyltransferase, cytosolic-like isoform X2 n=1 Tax=Paramacrobiotus metropolitanus TaxID=2943436 RepID=UPI002445E529|nr:acetyl-CoA acetyltransferase, cytosolic-like isoform X2 [Paramacrobiotus metropolitanus]